MESVFTPTTKDLRDWADNPAASRMVPVSPDSLRSVADRLDAQAAEIAALRVDAERYRFAKGGHPDIRICQYDEAECAWVKIGESELDAAMQAKANAPAFAFAGCTFISRPDFAYESVWVKIEGDKP